MGLIDFSLDDVGEVLVKAREAITGKRVLNEKEMKEVELKFEQLGQAINLGQIEINKIEAAHKSIFVAGWRPALGWVAAVSLFLMYVPRAIVMTAVWATQCYEVIDTAQDISKVVLPVFPELGAGDIIGLVASLLGMAGLRTIEKRSGVAREK